LSTSSAMRPMSVSNEARHSPVVVADANHAGEKRENGVHFTRFETYSATDKRRAGPTPVDDEVAHPPGVDGGQFANGSVLFD
jgi:hypothetical protein